MGTLTSLMNIAQEALLADQAGLNVTSNNVANQTTPGYTRETVSNVAQDTVTLTGKPYGDGVLASSPVSVRDRVLNQRVQQQTQIQSQSATVESALAQVQTVFGLSAATSSASLTQIGTAVDGFLASLTALQSNPSDQATRQAVLSAASTLASTFNSTSSQLSSVQSALNSQAQTVVGQVNTLLSTVASLNQQIASVSPTGDAGVLEDQRQQAIAQLSQYVGLDQITTSKNGIDLTTSNGGVLVSGFTAYPLSTSVVGGTAQVYAGPNATNITSGLTGGQLGGTLAVENQDLPPVTSAIDNLAYAIATTVNAQNSAGVDATGAPGGALFSITGSAPGAAAAIAVTTSDPQKVAAAGAGEGSAGNTNATALAAIGTSNIVAGQTADGYLAATLAALGQTASSATTDNTVQQASLTQLTSQQSATSSVSLNQEASNLTEYQRSYQAASQLFSIIDLLMASAINLGQQTAVQ